LITELLLRCSTVFLVICALASPLAAIQTASAQTLTLTQLPPHLECNDVGKTEHSATETTLRLTCTDPGRNLSCDAPGFEPFDVLLSAVCSVGRLPLVVATRVQLGDADSVASSLEWSRFDPNQGLVPVALRPINSTKTELLASLEATRIIRILRAGASPFSVTATQLRTGRVDIPSPVYGGELLVGVQRAAVNPLELELRPSGRLLKPVDGFASIAGLLPGRYSVRPAYSAGLMGPEVSFEIQPGQTTAISIGPADLGGATITQATESCSAQTSLNLNRVESRAGVSKSGIELVPIIKKLSSPNCQWKIEGLRPGMYRAATFQSDQALDSADFEVTSQQFSAVSLEQPKVSVFGRVTLNGEPVQQRTLEFWDTVRMQASPIVTDDEGEYRIFLRHPGEYLVRARGWSQSRKVLVRSEETRFDWVVDGGVLTVNLSGVTEPTTIEIRRSAPDFLSTQRVPASTTRHVFEGIPFGVFSVLARNSRASSRSERVELTVNSPEQSISLQLLLNRAVIAVKGEDGSPAERVLFRRMEAQPQESRPGVYSLENVHPGTELRLKPALPWSPVCILAPSNSDREVILSTGMPVMVEISGFERWELGRDLGGISGLPSSDCRVSFTDFGVRHISAEPRRLVFELANYPTVGGAAYYYPASGGQYLVAQVDKTISISKQ
jgi:hypothetical protein